MAVEGAQKARWTMEGPIPEVTKLPKPWKLFGQGSAPWPPYGNSVLVTDGTSVWVDSWGNCQTGDWRRARAWRTMPRTPNLGLVWPVRAELPPIPRFTEEEIRSLREEAAAAQKGLPKYTIPPGGVLERDEDKAQKRACQSLKVRVN